MVTTLSARYKVLRTELGRAGRRKNGSRCSKDAVQIPHTVSSPPHVKWLHPTGAHLP